MLGIVLVANLQTPYDKYGPAICSKTLGSFRYLVIPCPRLSSIWCVFREKPILLLTGLALVSRKRQAYVTQLETFMLATDSHTLCCLSFATAVYSWLALFRTLFVNVSGIREFTAAIPAARQNSFYNGRHSRYPESSQVQLQRACG